MPVNMDRLTNMAADFTTMGKDFVGVNDQTQRMEQKTQSFGQRFVAWIKSGGSAQRTENRAILDTVKRNVTRTLGDRYEAAFQDKIKSSFNSKRPIAGRKIAVALNEVMQMKKNDDAQALRSALQSNKAGVTTSPEARQTLQTAITEKAAQYHLNPQDLNVEKIQNHALARLDHFSSIGLEAATPEEIVSQLESAVHSECEDLLKQNSIGLVTNANPSATSQLQNAMREHGIQGDVSPRFLQAMCEKAGKEIMQASRGPNRTILQPTPEQVQTAVTRQVTKAVEALQAVQASPLDAAGKAAMTRAVLKSDSVISPAVVQVATRSLEPHGNLATLSRLFANNRQEKDTLSLKQEVMNMQHDYSEAFHGVQGLGGDDSVTIATLIMDTAMQNQTGDGHMNTRSGQGGLLVRTLYDVSLHNLNQELQNMEEGGQAGQLSFARGLLACFRNSGNENLDKLLADPSKPPVGLTPSEHLETIAHNHGKPSALPSLFDGANGAQLKQAMLADIRADVAKNAKPDNKVFAFDFARNFEVVINGQPQQNIPSGTTNVDSLLPAFGGNRDVMQKVLAQVHQGLGSHLLSPALKSYPKLLETQMNQSERLSQPSRANIQSNERGGYDVRFETAIQHADGAAFNMVLHFSLDDLQNPVPTISVNDVNYSIMNTAE